MEDDTNPQILESDETHPVSAEFNDETIVEIIAPSTRSIIGCRTEHPPDSVKIVSILSPSGEDLLNPHGDGVDIAYFQSAPTEFIRFDFGAHDALQPIRIKLKAINAGANHRVDLTFVSRAA